MTDQPSIKDQQVESVFDPKTEADKDTIELLRIADRLALRHKNDVQYLKLFGFITASALALNLKDGTLDQTMIENEGRRITDEFWTGGRE